MRRACGRYAAMWMEGRGKEATFYPAGLAVSIGKYDSVLYLAYSVL